jgi:DNA methyltransferase 1-associated protein 1
MDWTREETDYLFHLCQQFDLRFIVIADRYDYPEKERTLEELKERYYHISKMVIRHRHASGNTMGISNLDVYNYNKAKDLERRKGLDILFQRTQEEVDVKIIVDSTMGRKKIG